MMALTRVMGTNWHAVERDLLALGFHADDIGTPKLSVWELISIVVAAPPGSAVHFKTGSWSKEAEMLANLGEQQAGLLSLEGRYPRPGVQYQHTPRYSVDEKPAFGVSMQSFTVDEFTSKKRAWYANKQSKEVAPEEDSPEEVERMRRRLNGDPLDDQPGDWTE